MLFDEPVNFWVLLLILLAGGLLAAGFVARRRALARFAPWSMSRRLVAGSSTGRQVFRAVLLMSTLSFLALALTRPQYGVRPAVVEQRGVDVVIALDVSRSMLAEDVRPSRIGRALFQIRALLEALEGHRVGLVLFAGKAAVQCPLTLDHAAVRMFLDTVDPETFPVQGTAVEAAVRVAMQCFDPDDRQHKAIVLFTDGESHTDDPVGAAQSAAAAGVRLYAVGLGSTAGGLIPRHGEDGGISFHRDASGNPVRTRLDESTLQEMTRAAYGEYYRSTLAGAEISALAEQVNSMDKKDLGAHPLTEYTERYQIPLALALLCLFVEVLMGDGRTRTREWRGRFA